MTQLIWDGLFVGSLYALVALGYTLVYGIMKLLNFAHGDVYMLGAFIGLSVFGLAGSILGVTSPGMGTLFVVLVTTMVVSGTAGVVVERVAYRPLRHAPRLSLLITAVGASFALEYGVRAASGPEPRVYPVRIDGGSVSIAGARVSVQQLILMLVALVLMLALFVLLHRTRYGRAMRATALDPQASRLMGIDVDAVIAGTFFLASALAGAAGVMAGSYYGKAEFLMGFVIGLKAFTAAVIGGIGNIPGTMVGGLVLGLLESFGTAWLGGEWRDVFAFAVLILVLTIRPSGLFGRRELVRA